VSGGLAVRRRLPPVANRHLQRMPAYLRAAHQAWAKRTVTTASELARARLLAEAMIAAGDPAEALERQLLGLGVPPSLVGQVVIELDSHTAEGAA
jgi:hypothetical protein